MRVLGLLTLIAVAFTSQLPLIDTQPQDRTVSLELFNELEELSRLVDIAYCVGVQGPGIQNPFNCPNHCSDFPNLELVSTFSTGQLFSDSCGYVALSHLPSKPRLIVAFRGSYSLVNTLTDLATVPQEYIPYPSDGQDAHKCHKCTVHMGFWKSWENTRKVIIPNITMIMELFPTYELVLVGHSLGGAIASLAALDLLGRGFDPILTTFGEPRLGNHNLVDFLDDRFHLNPNSINPYSRKRRVTHVSDPVPLLPLEEWGYLPHGGEIYMSNSALPPSPEDLQHCIGQSDAQCSSINHKAHFLLDIPTRYKIWQLLFAHRYYFSRLGLCLPDLFVPPLNED